MYEQLKGKRLLILGGIRLACDIVDRAHKMGIYVVVADYLEDSPAKKIADKALLVDATDIDAICKVCVEEKIDGVTTGFVDILMPVCYEVCKRMGYSYYGTPKMLSMATNKVDFKETCIKYDVPVPKTYLLGGELTQDILKIIKYPVFVKPLDASGSRGAGVCYDEESLLKQFEEAVAFSASKNAIVEDYLTGREFLLDYVGIDGEWKLLSMFDRYMSSDRGSAINYSNIAIAPSAKIQNYYDKVDDKVINMFKSLGFKDGLLFMQGYTNGDDIVFYEMGSRLGGSFYYLEENIIEKNPVDMTICQALTGKMFENMEEFDSIPKIFPKHGIVCNYLLTGNNEVVARVDGIDEAKNLKSYVNMVQHRYEGFLIKNDRTVDKPILTFYLACDSLENARQDVKCLNEIIKVTNGDGKSLLSEKLNDF